MHEFELQVVQIWCQRKSRRSIFGKAKSRVDDLLERRTLLSFWIAQNELNRTGLFVILRKKRLVPFLKNR